MECKHEWVEDEMFKSGAVTMLFGNIGDVNEETKVICKKCGEWDYVKKCSFQEREIIC